MPRFMPTFFLMIYLFGATQLHELLKLPLLVVHYMEHEQQNSDNNLWDFLVLHYTNAHIIDEDYRKDQQLPFKDNACHGVVTPYDDVVAYIIVPQQTHFIQNILQIPHTNSPPTSAYLNTIWQPPRV